MKPRKGRIARRAARSARWAFALAAAALVGCGAPVADPPRAAAPAPPPGEASSFVSVISVSATGAIRFRIAAPADRALFVDHCNGAVSWGLETVRGDAGVPAWTAETDACHSAPIEIGAGRTRDFDVVVGAAPIRAAPPYRLAVYGLYYTHDAQAHADNVEVPAARRRSVEPVELPATSIDGTIGDDAPRPRGDAP